MSKAKELFNLVNEEKTSNVLEVTFKVGINNSEASKLDKKTGDYEMSIDELYKHLRDVKDIPGTAMIIIRDRKK